MSRRDVWESRSQAKIADGAVAQTYIHEQKITEDHARRFARLALRDLQSFALVTDGKKWQVWCPKSDEERVVDLIEKAREL